MSTLKLVLGIAVALIGTVVVAAFLRYGTASPCEALAKQISREALRQGGAVAMLGPTVTRNYTNAMMPSECVAAVYRLEMNTTRGFATSIDGDTLDVGGKRIRLYGIDAPELKQTCKNKDGSEWDCGGAAWAMLGVFAGHETVTCRKTDTDRYGRVVAVCYSQFGDIGRKMVRGGYALAYRKYSTEYVVAEAEAKSEGAGIWAGDFIPPWEWRKSR